MTQWRIPLADVRLSEDVISAAMDALDSNWLTMGPRTQALEAAFAERLGAAHAVAVSSGSAGLHLALLGVGVGPGDEVIVPAFSFVADAHAPHWCGGEAVFADVESSEQPLLDVASVEAAIGDRTKAVVAVHMFGYPRELAALRALCDERGIALIEDSCEAAGSVLADGAPTGTLGRAGVFSFFPKTQLPVGEGGIVVTDDETVAERVRLLRSHAMTSVTWDRHRGHAETYDITDLGFNYRIDEPRAAMAHAHLAELDGRLASLRDTAVAYRRRLSDLDHVALPFSDEQAARAGHYCLPVVVAETGLRDRVRARLGEQGVQTTVYPSITTLSLYREAGRARPCPVAEDFAERHLAMPASAALGPEDVAFACHALADALAAG